MSVVGGSREHQEQIARMQKMVAEFGVLVTESAEDWREKLDREEKAFDAILELNKHMPKGLWVGKLCHWAVGDGFAWYMVLEVRERTCLLQHIPEGDAYQWPGVTRANTCPSPDVFVSVQFTER